MYWNGTYKKWSPSKWRAQLVFIAFTKKSSQPIPIVAHKRTTSQSCYIQYILIFNVFIRSSIQCVFFSCFFLAKANRVLLASWASIMERREKKAARPTHRPSINPPAHLIKIEIEFFPFILLQIFGLCLARNT